MYSIFTMGLSLYDSCCYPQNNIKIKMGQHFFLPLLTKWTFAYTDLCALGYFLAAALIRWSWSKIRDFFPGFDERSLVNSVCKKQNKTEVASTTIPPVQTMLIKVNQPNNFDTLNTFAD